MATFIASVPVDMTGGSAGYDPGVITYADAFFIRAEFYSYFEEYEGFFGYSPSGVPFGELHAFNSYDYAGNILISWNADYGIYDFNYIYNLSQSGAAKTLLAYLFSLSDDITGSLYKDKLVGYLGNDILDGWEGNDKLWGDLGRDAFYFQRFDDKDTIKDFTRSQDEIWLARNLARNFGDVEDAARSYNKGVILDFGSDEIKIVGLKLSKLDKVEFDFL